MGVRQLLRRDGQIALVAQPRCPGATAATSQSAASELAGLLTRAGFISIQTTMLDLDPPVSCVQAANPDDASISAPATNGARDTDVTQGSLSETAGRSRQGN